MRNTYFEWRELGVDEADPVHRVYTAVTIHLKDREGNSRGDRKECMHEILYLPFM